LEIDSGIEQEEKTGTIAKRSRKGSPPQEWVYAAALKPGDRVMLGNKNVHSVSVSEKGDGSLWRLIFVDPEIAPMEGKPGSKAPASMPSRRDINVDSRFLYRRLLDS
jgi:hypothetical protein